jgi:lipopolysaccharide transport system permease protein
LNSSLVKKTVFPKSALVLSLVLQDMAHYILSLPVIAAFAFHYRMYPKLARAYGIPALLIVRLLMTFGAGLLLASINLFFHDISLLVNTLMHLLFSCTPILYSESMIPEKYRRLVHLNPVAPLMINRRSVLLEGRLLSGDDLLLSALYALIVPYAGHRVCERLCRRFAEVW